MTEFANDSTQVIIEQANRQVEMQIKEIERLIEVIESDSMIKEFMQERLITTTDTYLMRLDICNMLEMYKEAYSEIAGMAVVTHTGNYISNEMYKSQKSNLNTEDWYIECAKNKDDYMLIINPVSRNLTYYETISANELLCIGKAVVNEAGNVTGVVLVDIRQEVIKDILDSITIGKDGFVIIMDDQENLLYSPVNAIAPRIRSKWFDDESGIFEKVIQNERFQFIYKDSKEFKWKTIGVFSLEATLTEVVETREALIIILAAAAVLAFMMALLFSSTIVHPILKLEELMTKAHEGHLYVRFHARYRDEIGSLGRTFNLMLDKMQTLIDQVMTEQKKKRYAELNALQAQIKPHFLYNTFDTIHWLAKKYGAKDIVYIIHCLTNLFRIGLSSGSEIIPLREEVAHVENYLKIQKVRYEDILDFEVNIDDEQKRLFVHKLILQPIVENALYHGLKALREGGKIIITAERKTDHILIRVADDGVGMEKEKVDHLNRLFEADKNEGMGYGLFNVDQRIKLSYGKEFGLHVESEKGKGTIVEIKYPIITHLGQVNKVIITNGSGVDAQKEHKNVKDNDSR